MDAVDNGLFADRQTKRRSAYAAFSLTISLQPVVQASAKRVRLHFIGDGTQLIQLTTDAVFAGLHAIHLSLQTQALILDYETHGTLVQAPWNALSSVAGGVLTVIETVQD
jgi:hypothetical protein